MSPPVAARNSAPRTMPSPGMLVITSTSRCSRNRASIALSISATCWLSAITSVARACTIRAVSFSPGRLVCRRPAASGAVARASSASHSIRFNNRWIRSGPACPASSAGVQPFFRSCRSDQPPHTRERRFTRLRPGEKVHEPLVQSLQSTHDRTSGSSPPTSRPTISLPNRHRKDRCGNLLVGEGISSTAGFGVPYEGLHGIDERAHLGARPGCRNAGTEPEGGDEPSTRPGGEALRGRERAGGRVRRTGL